MQQLLNLWSHLDLRRRGLVVLATVAVFAAVLGLSRMAATPSMALLYSGLDNAQAGDVIQALDQQGATYDVRGGAIYVDASLRDQLRMTLAGDGLPADSGAGYELLDTLSGFGTTSQMFDAAYWRAKEGELARTIVANRTIRNARVHIANSSATPFRRAQNPTASVSITTAGTGLTDENATAFRYLVASAVAGLSPDDVAIIDATTGRVLGPKSDSDAQNSGDDKATALKANVERLLEARVGPGNAIVEVSIESVTDRESILERRFDPQSRVAISTDVEEISTSETNAGGAGVTVASNLPDGAAAAGNDGNSQSQNSETRERTNYEVSETTREITRTPGAIKRLTVAVLLNGLPAEAGVQGRPDAELDSLRELVASAVGFDESRGDVITLKSLEFGAVPQLGTEATAGVLGRLALEPMRLLQLGVLSLVALALGLFVVRPILSGQAAQTDLEQLSLSNMRSVPSDGAGEDASIVEGSAVSATAAGDRGIPAIAQIQNPVGPEAALTPIDAGHESVANLKKLIEDRRPDTIEILRSWLEDDSLEESV
ncbi:flagellar basal-body MS-ring/collar protein FliF [Pseudoruegeria sp. SK021]|uniref:flagellar basal-body MS-ring/collar protein FliF n=1 Tax=Pseudoruegeria sp. SK021 TaxID=1933035 RepID=UPI000A2214F7|nr:flagellar basal-body MS-ring/collar protein FliF [Pseudoruegeria sp. SK021]OSP56806.1 flagellar M-ring protein FliF [Pseudoruegeria sp. SK021]